MTETTIVFISYRRSDSAPWAGRICDRLGAAFGADNIFMDVQDIAPGSDFAESIGKTVGSCDVLVAVIGPQWLETLHQRSDANDFVEHEIAVALSRGITVVPVLVGGASMPTEGDLPPELAQLAWRQALSVRDAGFDQDVSELIRAIRRAVGGGHSARRLVWLVLAAGIVIALIGSAVLLLKARADRSLDGVWIARMQRPGLRPYNIRLTLVVDRKSLEGQVEYPTGTAAIQGGAISDGRIAFFTKHIPQFESEPATITFSGQVRGREILLTAITPDGAATRGTARKQD